MASQFYFIMIISVCIKVSQSFVVKKYLSLDFFSALKSNTIQHFLIFLIHKARIVLC